MGFHLRLEQPPKVKFYTRNSSSRNSSVQIWWCNCNYIMGTRCCELSAPLRPRVWTHGNSKQTEIDSNTNFLASGKTDNRSCVGRTCQVELASELVRRCVLFLVQARDSACFEFLRVTRSSSSLCNNKRLHRTHLAMYLKSFADQKRY